jgi:sugar lactone lactonase YvrE
MELPNPENYYKLILYKLFFMKPNLLLAIALTSMSFLVVSCSKTMSNKGGTGTDSTGNGSQNNPGAVSTLAGNSNAGFSNGLDSLAEFNSPMALALDAQGNVYVVDGQNYMIRKVTPQGLVSTFAGNGSQGYVDGPGNSAEFQSPNGIAVDAQGNVYVSEGASDDDNRIRKISPAGVVSTFAGKGKFGFADGPAAKAQFFSPAGLAFDQEGNLYVADQYNNRIRKITPAGQVSTLAGDGHQGAVDGAPSTAEFSVPADVSVDLQGNVYVADDYNAMIRKITGSGVVSTLAGSSNNSGTQNGKGTAAQFVTPTALVVNTQGTVYETDGINNSSIRQITPDGVVTTLTGNVDGGFEDGPLSKALFSSPLGLALDAKGNLYVADEVNNRIRKITLH